MAVTGKTTKSKTNSALNRMAPLTKSLFIIGFIVLALSFFAWYQFVRNTAQNTFESMLENSFRTASVTRRVVQDSGSQKLDQVIRFQNQTEHTVHGKTLLTQKVGNEATAIETESIGTPTVDLIRYTKITTDQKNLKGEAINFDKVIGVWGKSTSPDGEQIADLYSDTALGLFLFGDFSSSQRQSLMNTVQENNVYQPDYENAKKFTKDGRSYFMYKVTIKPSSYVKLLKQYGEYAGIKQLESLNPQNYEETDDLTFNVTVDIISQRLAAISAIGGSRIESFSGYGIIQPIEIPIDTIDLPDLQKLLNETTSV